MMAQIQASCVTEIYPESDFMASPWNIILIKAKRISVVWFIYVIQIQTQRITCLIQSELSQGKKLLPYWSKKGELTFHEDL